MKVRFAMRLVLSMLMTGVFVSAAGCDEVEDEPEEEEEEEEVAGPLCTEPTSVPCEDEVFVDLTMNLDEPAPGTVTSVPDGDTFTASIDGTAGGFGGSGGWVYAKFTPTGLQKVELLDADSFTSMDWDISFRRFVIRLNSGYGGPSCVSAARTAVDTDFDTLTSVPDGLTFAKEEFMTPPDDCTLVPDGSGLGAAGVVLQNWWEYPGCVATTGNVYVVALADGSHVKLVVTDYYQSGQAGCNETGTAGEGSANFKLRYGFIE